MSNKDAFVEKDVEEDGSQGVAEDVSEDEEAGVSEARPRPQQSSRGLGDIASETMMGTFAGWAGTTSSGVHLSFGDFFSSVPAHHKRGEVEELLSGANSRMTVDPRNVETNWPHPWVYSRVLFWFIALALLFWFLGYRFDAYTGLASFLIVGALLTPLSLLVFFFETNALRNVSIVDTMGLCFGGGAMATFGAIATSALLYTEAPLARSIDGAFCYTVCMLLAIVAFMAVRRQRNCALTGLLIGAAVGAGLSIFISAGWYLSTWDKALNSGASNAEAYQNVVNVIAVRSLFVAVGANTAWGAIMGGALMSRGTARRFGLSQLFNPGFLKYFVLVLVLRFLWDAQIPFVDNLMEYADLSPKSVLLTIVAWGAIVALLHRGLDQVNDIIDGKVQVEE